MKIETTEITLKSTNYGREHSFVLIEKDGELLLSAEGRTFAKLTLQTMEKDVKDDDGDYHTKPSNNFFVCFHPTDPCAKDIANVWLGTPAASVPSK